MINEVLLLFFSSSIVHCAFGFMLLLVDIVGTGVSVVSSLLLHLRGFSRFLGRRFGDTIGSAGGLRNPGRGFWGVVVKVARGFLDS